MKAYLTILKDCYKALPRITRWVILWSLLMHTGWLIIPQYLWDITKAILGNNVSLLTSLTSTLLIITVITIIIERLENLTTDYLVAKLEVVRMLYYRSKLLWLSHHQITNEWSGKIISKVNKWVDAEVQIYLSLLKIVVTALFRGWIIFYLIVQRFPQVLRPALWVIVWLLALQYWFSSKSNPLSDLQSDNKEVSTRNMVRQIQEHLMVHLNSKQQYEHNKDKANYHDYANNETRIAFYNYTVYDIMHLFFRFGELACLFWVGQMVGRWEIGYEIITITVTYIWFFRWPLESAMSRFMIINKQSSYYHKLYNFAHQKPDITDGTLPYHYQWGHICFDNVQFGYQSDADILHDFNLTFDAGSTTALVGHSWSGKSTIVKLLLRLYDIQWGKITIDWQTISSLKIASFYSHVGYLTQEPAIFDGTVRENLEYGISSDSSVDEWKLWQALEYAQFDGLIHSMIKWLDTQIGERWVKLSWGEKQRLAIARIFLRNPDILILDEPTAALDSISEHKITQLITEMMKGKTVIIIAHRLQTVMNADRIIVMDHGQIIQSGTHQQLINQPWMYQTLVNFQSGMIGE